MNNRWKMNRIGFVNFWLYDEEDFQFEDGRLLLRGQNGSGKSITTQSFIPFILDGDRTPSRLDPFGLSLIHILKNREQTLITIDIGMSRIWTDAFFMPRIRKILRSRAAE